MSLSDLDHSPSRSRTRTRARSSSRLSNFSATTATSGDNDDPDPAQDPNTLPVVTSFDAYFLQASRPSRTSSNVFSQLVQPLSADEYAVSLSRSYYPLPFPPSSPRLQDRRAAHPLPRYLLELADGFNLLFYGLGSKRAALNDLARASSRNAHVLVVNGFLPSCSARDVLAALARLPGAPQSVEDVARFLFQRQSQSQPENQRREQQRQQQQQQQQQQKRSRRLVLVVHNLDAPALRAPKAHAVLRALAALRGVRIAASVDHINAALQWTSTELLAGRWLWHDLSTLAPYDAELAGADPTSLRGGAAGARSSGEGAAAGMTPRATMATMATMTETAARHVLAAVTQRARKLFVLMGRRQLDALADAAVGGGVDLTTPAEAGEVAIAYDMLFNLARDHFVATNDTALRALLGEFRDHGLIVTVGTGAMGSGESLWIPLRKERLTKLLDGLESPL
ncbi:origin recognition complex subunit 2-domain-containing protein [Russula earlei]|uniref:Origin recognition complex subunit 2-domain-containing protein n=1 Tax=Russula earlei TaxID=71964 RepID=A0ACC0UMV1_9AGAM|nr:origin recognition complex subunit 2-domain-containing protein [Russula earlei]